MSRVIKWKLRIQCVRNYEALSEMSITECDTTELVKNIKISR